jgi:hypothetical protein
MYTWLNINSAGVVLLHIGTNRIVKDNLSPETCAGQVRRISDEIERWERDNGTPITVFLALIVGCSNEDGAFPNPRVDYTTNSY